MKAEIISINISGKATIQEIIDTLEKTVIPVLKGNQYEETLTDIGYVSFNANESGILISNIEKKLYVHLNTIN